MYKNGYTVVDFLETLGNAGIRVWPFGDRKTLSRYFLRIREGRLAEGYPYAVIP